MDSTPTIFLTGATGQLGSFLLAEFLGFGSSSAYTGQVICSVRASSSLDQIDWVEDFYKLAEGTIKTHKNIHFVACELLNAHNTVDILDQYCLKNEFPMPSEVIHAAATINISPGTSKSTSNAKLTDEVLLLAELLEVAHFSHVSSVAVLGGTAPLGESETLDPEDFHPNRSKAGSSDYALSKMESELGVWRAQAEGMSVSIVRPGVILGIGPKASAPQKLWQRVYDNSLPFITEGCSGVVDVRDVAMIVRMCHESRMTSPVTAVSKNIDFNELVMGMASGLGLQLKVQLLHRIPWLNRMRAFSFLRHVPIIGPYFTAQMRIMLFSRLAYNGASGESMVKDYISPARSFADFGALLSERWGSE